jgi:hypothetical protein
MFDAAPTLMPGPSRNPVPNPAALLPRRWRVPLARDPRGCLVADSLIDPIRPSRKPGQRRVPAALPPRRLQVLDVKFDQVPRGALYGKAGFVDAVPDNTGLTSCFLSLRFVRPLESAFHRK